MAMLTTQFLFNLIRRMFLDEEVSIDEPNNLLGCIWSEDYLISRLNMRY